MHAITAAINAACITAVERYARGVHAPTGGITIGGKQFRGGEFIPKDVVAAATTEEQSQLQETRAGFEAATKTGDKPKERRWIHADESGDLPAEIAERAQALKIPPGLTGVQIASDPKSPLQAVGYDAKGRMKRIYSTEATSQNAAAKWQRVADFMKPGGGLDKFREKATADINGPEGPDKEAALVLYLQDRSAIRIGSDRDTGAKVKAYGASTLEADHLTVDGDVVRFDFIGKEGVRNTGEFKDARLAQELAPRIKRGGRIFNVSSAKIAKYLKDASGGDFKVKDLRTVAAAESALAAIKTMEPPSDEQEFQKSRRQVGLIVAERLNHVAKLDKRSGEMKRSPDMALNNYIPPEVFSAWQANLLSSGPASNKPDNLQKTSATAEKSAKKWSGKSRTRKTSTSDATEPYSRLTSALNAVCEPERYSQPAAEQVSRYKNLTDAINQQVDELAGDDDWGDASFDPSQFSRIMGENSASVFADAISIQIAQAMENGY